MLNPTLKKSLLLISFCFSFFVPFLTQAADYVEGKQYTRFSDQATSGSEIREYFSFYCSHCFEFETLLKDVKQDLDDSVKFERNHVDLLRGSVTPEIQRMLSKSIIVAKELKIEEKIVLAIFNHIHTDEAEFSSEQDIRALFIANGVDADKYDSLVNNADVISRADNMKAMQDVLVEEDVLVSVPMFIINNKYRINPGELDHDNFEQDFKRLTNYLLTLK